MPTFRRSDLELSYEILGDGPPERTIVFMHGLLLSAEMMAPLARTFAERFRVVNLELHGHGRSSKPHGPSAYTLSEFALDVVGLADHLQLERVAVFGTSLGADVGLAAMLDSPQRIAGAVLEMPVLTHGTKFARRVFTPVIRGLRSRRAPKAMSFIARRMPAWPPGFPEAAAMLADDPVAGAAVIEGLLADADIDRWPFVSACQVPAMIIGHRLDPLHAYADAVELAARLPNGYLVKATSILELRLRPGRILNQAIAFIDQVFTGAPWEGVDTTLGESTKRTTEGTGAG